MKTTFTANIQVQDKEILEAEVIEIMKAYAKSIARQAITDEIESEIKNEVERLVNVHLGNLKNTYFFNNASVNKIIKSTINDEVIRQLQGYSALDNIRSAYDELLELERKRAKSLTENYFATHNMEENIMNIAKEMIPEYVLDAFKKSMESK